MGAASCWRTGADSSVDLNMLPHNDRAWRYPSGASAIYGADAVFASSISSRREFTGVGSPRTMRFSEGDAGIVTAHALWALTSIGNIAAGVEYVDQTGGAGRPRLLRYVEALRLRRARGPRRHHRYPRVFTSFQWATLWGSIQFLYNRRWNIGQAPATSGRRLHTGSVQLRALQFPANPSRRGAAWHRRIRSSPMLLALRRTDTAAIAPAVARLPTGTLIRAAPLSPTSGRQVVPADVTATRLASTLRACSAGGRRPALPGRFRIRTRAVGAARTPR
jgi:hypothetical protein